MDFNSEGGGFKSLWGANIMLLFAIEFTERDFLKHSVSYVAKAI